MPFPSAFCLLPSAFCLLLSAFCLLPSALPLLASLPLVFNTDIIFTILLNEPILHRYPGPAQIPLVGAYCMDARFAFTAQYWGDGAVISRAIEDRPGPIVEQQFGEFKTWTQAQNFASKLNEGLDLDYSQVRRIVTSSFLATACVIQEALNSKQLWVGSRAERQARETQFRFVLSELAFAITLCRTAALLSGPAAVCTFTYAQEALRHTKQFLLSSHGDYGDLEGLVQQAETLQKALQSPPPRVLKARQSGFKESVGKRDDGWPLPPAVSFAEGAVSLAYNAAPNSAAQMTALILSLELIWSAV